MGSYTWLRLTAAYGSFLSTTLRLRSPNQLLIHVKLLNGDIILPDRNRLPVKGIVAKEGPEDDAQEQVAIIVHGQSRIAKLVCIPHFQESNNTHNMIM